MSLSSEAKSLRAPGTTDVLITVILSILLAVSAYYLDGARAAATGLVPALALLQLSQRAGISFKTPWLFLTMVLLTAAVFILGGALGMQYLPPHTRHFFR